jgi:tetratricopeptide (TPR) repeat protein/tRNA A-37 threonylcarbamoyl transferase component Bud32
MSGGRDDDSPADPEALAKTAPTPERHTAPAGAEGISVRTFQPGDVVARRYRVLRFIARGGMGEVYEVEDLELHLHVALKTLRSDLADDDTLLDRFRREINLSRKVTHANVCRIFDLGFHTSPRGRVTFLTMELLDGESLRRRIKRSGRMSVDEALPIVEQMARGLDAAHVLGVVHRDFKSDNVMLVASPSSSGALRAVVTDFGLARSQEASLLTSDAGRLRGTPAYMAPEQVTGGSIGPAADVYALGVVLYEMVTGVLPFSGENAMEVALKRVTSRAPSPRKRAPGLDARWEQVILRCLQRDPGARFASAGAVVEALRDPSLPIAARPPRAVLALILVLCLALSGLIGLGALRRTKRTAPPRRRSAAILALRDLSNDPKKAWLGTAIGELLAAEMSADGVVRRVADETVARARRELKLPEGPLSTEALARARAALDADFVLDGTYLALPDGQLRLDVSLQDTATGETAMTDSESGAESALFELVARAGAKLRHHFGARPLSEAQAASARAALPVGAEAAEAYAAGIERLRLLDALGARPLLEKATSLEPGFALAHAALSEALRDLGHVAEAEREAKRAFDSAAGLPRDQQLLVEAAYRTAAKEWDRAIELMRSLANFYPDSIDYAHRLARLQLQAGRTQDALSTLERLRHDAPAADRDPRIDQVESIAQQNLANYSAQLAAAQRAEQKARAMGATELVGDALLSQSFSNLQTGDRPRADQLARQAQDLFAGIGDERMVAEALIQRDKIAGKTGDPAGGLKLALEARDRFQKVGDEAGMARALLCAGADHSDLGHDADAMVSYKAALAGFERVGRLNGQASCHTNIGQMLERAGRYEEARVEVQRGLDLNHAAGLRHGEGIGLETLSGLSLSMGELDAAADYARKSIALATEIHDVTTVAQSGLKLGRVLRYQGELARAEEELRRAIATLQQQHETVRVGFGQADLARVLLDADRVAEAETQARDAVGILERGQVNDSDAACALTAVLLARGRVDDARAVAEAGVARAPEQLDGQIALAGVELAEHRPAEAIARLEKALAVRPPDVRPRLEANLLIGRALAAEGKTREAETRLRAVAAEAGKRGFVGLAKRAAAPTVR